MATPARWAHPRVEHSESLSGQEPHEFVGRGGELRELRRALAQAVEGSGTVVLLTGERGVGKTRLCREALSLKPPSVRVLSYASLNDGEPSVPLRPIIDSLRATRRDPQYRAWAALRSRARWLSALLPELGTDHWASPPAPTDQHLLFECVLDAIDEASKHAGTAWLLDDMHWADEASWAFVRYAARQITGRHLVLMVAISEYEMGRGPLSTVHVAELASEPAVLHLSLDQLPRADTERLVQTIARGQLPADTLAEIVGQSAGNPRLAQELVALRVKGSEAAVPDSVRLAVRRASAGLDVSACRLLKVLSIVGPQADIELILGLSPEAGDEEVAQLVEAGLVQLHGRVGRAGLGFRHPVLGDAVRADIGWLERRRLHLEVARALERRLEGPERAVRLVEVARHRHLAGDAEGALQLLVAGTESQRRLGDVSGAATLSLAAVQLALEDPAVAPPRITLVWEALKALSQAGRWAELLPVARQAWAERGHLTRRQAAELAWFLAAGQFMSRKVDEGWALVDSEIAHLGSAGETLEVPGLLAAGAAIATYLGRSGRSRELAETASRSSQPGIQQFARCLLSINEFHQHRDREASARTFQAIAEEARAHQQPTIQAFALWNRARMSTVIADAHEAEAVGDRSGSWLGSLSRLLLADLHLLEGRPSPAAETLELARGELQFSAPLLEPMLDASQAHLHLHRGELDLARPLLERWAAASSELAPIVRVLIAGGQGWLAWEEGDLERTAERLGRCAGFCLSAGYGLCELGPILLPLQVDALARLGRVAEASRAVSEARAYHRDRFFSAAVAVATFRLQPTPTAGLDAEHAAARAPWPWLEGLAACWRAQTYGDIEAAETANDRFAAIGSLRGAQRAMAALRRMGAWEHGRTPKKPGVPISDREMQVAKLIAQGLTNQAIAERLFVSRATVATHVKHLLAKLGLVSRVQIAAWLADQRATNGPLTSSKDE